MTALAWRVPWTLIVFLAALSLPWIGSRYYTFLGTQIAIYALFAMSLNLLLGTTGLVSFGHAAYFGIGAYACGILMKTLGVPFCAGFSGGRSDRGGLRACVRLLLRAPDQDLFRDADPGLRADRLGHLLQVERRDRRRAGSARRAVSRTSPGSASLPGCSATSRIGELVLLLSC